MYNEQNVFIKFNLVILRYLKELEIKSERKLPHSSKITIEESGK